VQWLNSSWFSFGDWLQFAKRINVPFFWRQMWKDLLLPIRFLLCPASVSSTAGSCLMCGLWAMWTRFSICSLIPVTEGHDRCSVFACPRSIPFSPPALVLSSCSILSYLLLMAPMPMTLSRPMFARMGACASLQFRPLQQQKGLGSHCRLSFTSSRPTMVFFLGLCPIRRTIRTTICATVL